METFLLSEAAEVEKIGQNKDFVLKIRHVYGYFEKDSKPAQPGQKEPPQLIIIVDIIDNGNIATKTVLPWSKCK